MQTTLVDWRSFNAEKQLLADKTILITGAAQGIGQAVSLSAAQHGATVILLDKKNRHLEKTYDEIVALGYPEPVMLPQNLQHCDPQTAMNIAEGIAQDFGHLDGLLHNAAELGSPSPMDQYDLLYWQEVMQVNLQAPYFLTRALLPQLREADNAQVLFTTARCARTPSAYWGAYGVAYGGVEAQMKIWADELENPTTIQVNSIDPGPVKTTLRRRSHPGESAEKLPSPSEIAPAYLQLLSGQHEFNGVCLRLQEDL